MTSVTDADARELLAGRLVDSATQAMEALGVYLGVELGLSRHWLSTARPRARTWPATPVWRPATPANGWSNRGPTTRFGVRTKG
jgi:hypothetical protein